MTFLDHIISRIAVANGLRNHFPIIIELPSAADVEDIMSLGQFQLGSIPIIEVPGFLHHTLQKSSIAKILPAKIIERLHFVLGKSPAVWTDAIKELSQGGSFNDLINGNSDLMKKDAIIAEAKINRIFTTLEAQQNIYDSTIIPELIQHLRLFGKARGRMVVDRIGYYIDFIKRPIFQAMMREGLFYHNFYLPHCDTSRLSYFPGLLNIKNRLLKQYWKQFLLWRLKNRRRFNIYGN